MIKIFPALALALVAVNAPAQTVIDEGVIVRFAIPNPKISIEAVATDDSGAAGITSTLAINNKIVGTYTGGTIKYVWNTRKVAPGEHTITIISKDAAGNTRIVSMVGTK